MIYPPSFSRGDLSIVLGLNSSLKLLPPFLLKHPLDQAQEDLAQDFEVVPVFEIYIRLQDSEHSKLFHVNYFTGMTPYPFPGSIDLC